MLRIETPEQAAPFIDPKRRRMLVQFMGRERSLSEAARALDMPMNRLAYHVSAFLRLGLLDIVREQKRPGRAIRYYRMKADAVLVPAEAMRNTAGEALATELREMLAKADQLAGHQDLLLSLDDEGRPRLSRSGGAESDSCEYWRVLQLTKREARQLGQAYMALLRSHQHGPGGGRSSYLVHLAMAPRRIP